MSSPEKLDMNDLSKQELFCCKEAFRMFDTTINGQLSVKDVRKALLRFNNGRRRITEKDVVKVMKKIDKDSNGFFDFYEFVELLVQIENEEEDYYYMLFDQFDFQNKGEVTPFQLRKSLQAFNLKITLQEAKRIVERYDDDKSGSLNVKQFKRLMDIYEAEKYDEEMKERKEREREDRRNY